MAEVEKSNLEMNESKKMEQYDEKEALVLPSYILAYNQKYFTQLFLLLNFNNDTISQKVNYFFLYFFILLYYVFYIFFLHFFFLLYYISFLYSITILYFLLLCNFSCKF